MTTVRAGAAYDEEYDRIGADEYDEYDDDGEGADEAP